MKRQPLADGEPIYLGAGLDPAMPPEAHVRLPEDEPDRVTVHANGLVVDVIANADGSVYVEAYSYRRERIAAVTDARTVTARKPSMTLHAVPQHYLPRS